MYVLWRTRERALIQPWQAVQVKLWRWIRGECSHPMCWCSWLEAVPGERASVRRLYFWQHHLPGSVPRVWFRRFSFHSARAHT
jgi:hypothetical protein